jgi:hypothetical protein
VPLLGDGDEVPQMAQFHDSYSQSLDRA